ncbi:MAG: hypothetical protein IPH60_00115 [Flavobacteriales bacterium]|nr:hypothetical protein [Flavobacteriales bacterium]
MESIVKSICDDNRTNITAICGKGLNAIDENFEIAHFIALQLGQIHPVSTSISRSTMQRLDLLERTERANIHSCVTSNMEKGMKEGLYRKDLNIPVIARITSHVSMRCAMGSCSPRTNTIAERDLGDVPLPHPWDRQ